MENSRRVFMLGSATATLGLLVVPKLFAGAADASAAVTRDWVFDRLDSIGGVATHVEGHPKLIDSPLGKALEFNGVDDALFIDQHPLAGAATFTFEAIFRPDGGAFAQRWFHLASDEAPPAPGAKPVNTRFLFEIRVVEANWYLDAFVNGVGYNKALALPDKLHRIGRWYHVAQSFDGKTYRSFVNGELQGEADINFQPQGPGRASVGVRMTHQDYFKGAIRLARFTQKALAPEQFLKA